MGTSRARNRLKMGLGLGLATLLGGGYAFAQEAEVGEDIVVVTGSRLVSSVDAAQPVVTVTSAALQFRGETAVADSLAQLPALLVSNTSEQSLRDGAVTGRTELNLRGLGSQRTLVLVNGRRHVAGAPGTSAVDTSTIPAGLVERVEVLTGGASAVYGSDAVTGVVNFIMKEDFSGQQLDFQFSQALDEGDSDSYFGSLLVGENFDNGKGNLTVAFQAEKRNGISRDSRKFSANNALANDQANPALRFQAGDPLPPGVTAAEAIGVPILSGGSPTFAGTAQSLIDRARSASPFLIAGDTRFSISATPGLIAFDPLGFLAPLGTDFLEANLDIDGNGVEDCAQSYTARLTNSFFSGCWIVDRNTGRVRPFQDGLIADDVNQFGGDGAEQYTGNDSLTPTLETLSFNVTTHYDIAEAFKPYAELKVVRNKASEYAYYNTYDDTLTFGLDNPYIPAELRALAQQEIAAQTAADPGYDASAFRITMARDHIDIFDPLIENERSLFRGVAGVKGDLGEHLAYDVSYNYGRTDQTVTSSARLRDRFFAAADATVDANGNPVCRISLTGEEPIASFLDPEAFSPVPAVTYNPSECQPLNLFGLNKSSAAALEFQRYRAKSKATLEQTVLQGTLVGDSGAFFSLPGGPIEMALGAEYREEKCDFRPDIVNQNGLAWEQRTTAAVQGKFDVSEAFAEISLPLLSDLPFADTLRVTAAGRTGDYSTVGSTSTWKADLVWAPIKDIRFRGGKSETIRAPNITELFLAPQNVNSNPRDPCLAANIGLGPNPANRLANCSAALGLDLSTTSFNNTRTSQFSGTRLGNPNLKEETSEAFTYGVVLQPRFVPGLTITADYWDIRIENGIATVEQDDLVAACYDAPSLSNQFCSLFSRNVDVPTSAFDYGWIESITVQDLNFAALEASGLDFDITYDLDLSQWGGLVLSVAGTLMDTNNRFPFPSDPNTSNPSLKELYYPETSYTLSAQWELDRLQLGWFTSYQSEQALRGVEIEDAQDWTPALADETWVHNMSASFDLNDNVLFIAGVNNVFDEQPILGETSFPVSAIGRSAFMRVSLRH